MFDFLRPGDVLMVTRIDRFTRSIADHSEHRPDGEGRGASLKATKQPIDASTTISKCFLDMLGVFAKFETNLRREQQVTVAKLFICFARVSL